MKIDTEKIWDGWNPEQKRDFALLANGGDTPMKRITASVDSVSSYGCASRKTRKYMDKVFTN